MRSPARAANRPRISLSARGGVLVLLAAASAAAPSTVWYVADARARRAELSATAEAMLASALAVHVDRLGHAAESYADWVHRLEARSAGLIWAAALEVGGEGVEFRRRTSIPLEAIRAQIDFSEREPHIRRLAAGGTGSQRLTLLTFPQPQTGVVLAAVVSAEEVGLRPGWMFVTLAGLACGGIAASLLWLHFGLLRPVARSTAMLANLHADAGPTAPGAGVPAELNGLLETVQRMRDELAEWKARADTLARTIDRRVEARVRAATRAMHRARAEADTDVLSGLGTRRMLERRLPELIELHRASGRELSVILADVNGFKRYNDTCGHAAGDALISATGGLIRASIRSGRDIGARWGGDEFVVVLPDTPMKEALEIAGRLAVLFNQFARTLPVAATPPSLATGVAALHEHRAVSADHLLKLADAAMYGAKRARLAVTSAHEIHTAASAGQAPRTSR